MPDLISIIAVLNGLKTATEIAKTVKDIDISIEKAELKLQMAELINAIADAKVSVAEIQEVVAKKDKEIGQLKESLQMKAHLVRYRDAYYEQNEKGKETGMPYCSHCWEANKKLIHLHSKGVQRICAACNTIYWQEMVLWYPDLIQEKKKK